MNQFIHLKTQDDLKINSTLYKSNCRDCMIVAPGFAQHSGTLTMTKICEDLSKYTDVLCLDFRGTGQSQGGFYFGEKEYLDVGAALKWAEKLYDKIFLMGFSLGAYSALRAVTHFDNKVTYLFLVSCPTKVDDIFWSGAGFKHTFDQIFRQKALLKERHLFFKWRYPFKKKPSAALFSPKLTVPVSFIVGGLDLLTPPSMGLEVYEAIKNVSKEWLEIPHGNHAEELFFSAPKEIESWIKKGLNRSK